MIKRSSVLLLILVLSGCLENRIREERELNNVFLDMQRMSMWHREYSFLVIKYRGRNDDSVQYYEQKMDSALSEYQYYNRRYNELVNEYRKQK